MLSAEPEDLSSIPRIHTVEEENDFLKLFSDLHLPTIPLAWPSLHTLCKAWIVALNKAFIPSPSGIAVTAFLT